MTTVINLGLHGGRIGGIFITGIFGNFYTKRGGFLTFKTVIPGGLDYYVVLSMQCVAAVLHNYKFSQLFRCCFILSYLLYAFVTFRNRITKCDGAV